MTCGYVPFLVMTITANSPRIPREFAEKVASATQSTQIASMFAGGISAGAALARAMAVRSMIVCDADSAVSSGVLDPGFALCPSDTFTAGTTTTSATFTSPGVCPIASNAALFLVVAMRTPFVGGYFGLLHARSPFVRPLRQWLDSLLVDDGGDGHHPIKHVWGCSPCSPARWKLLWGP